MALAVAALAGSVFPIFSILYSDFIVAYFNPSDAYLLQRSDELMGALFALAAAAGALVWAQSYLFTLLGERLTRRLRGATYRAILRQDMAFHDEPAHASGRLVSRLAGDACLVKATVGERVGIVVQSASALAVGYIIAFVASWRLALVLVAISPLLVLGALVQVRAQQEGAAAKDAAMADAGNIAVEAVSCIRTVAAYNLQARTLERFQRALDEPTRVAIRQGVQGGFYTATAQLLLFLSYSLIWYVGSLFIEDGTITFQALTRAYFAVVLASRGSGIASAQAADAAKAEGAKRNIFSLLDSRSRIDPLADGGGGGGGGTPPPPAQFQPPSHADALREVAGGAITPAAPPPPSPPLPPPPPLLQPPITSIRFEHVTFRYPSREHPALSDVSLELTAGQRVGVCGPSGSGKSTLISLLERFYDPQAGRILVNGVDIRRVPVRQLRSRLALVMQMPALMAGTVAESVVYPQDAPPPLPPPPPSTTEPAAPADAGGTPAAAAAAAPAAPAPTPAPAAATTTVEVPATLADAAAGERRRAVRQALADANALEFVDALPHGEQTQVGLGGSQLSGGQRQRVAIARAIARQPDVLLLDEATAALDTRSESLVAAALERVMQQRGGAATAAGPGRAMITVNVAHRLSTIAHCDRILVLDRGRLVADGSHEELMRQPRGLYRQLALAQGAGPPADVAT